MQHSISSPSLDTCFINLTGAEISNFKFRYKRFKLWFPEPDSARPIWEQAIKADYELKSGVYEDLLKKQKDDERRRLKREALQKKRADPGDEGSLTDPVQAALERVKARKKSMQEDV